ncbi:CAF17-like 4Fe-4S cluster assembly/insertion protein YgfZ [Halobellus limi]|jgi:aminomethyltransferase|uniref:Aminomethyl transferase family protein n=1 Tax=Halobellus limi TaxID=699433 RepID=A0A1H5W3K1_9EURY|nr:aminomethyltransferase family protein [Halobellus limi]QCC46545.1 aminomethyl transferase family protein [Halobellus limi]SEF93963.1 aminomethyltransferase [Halobellus limi]
MTVVTEQHEDHGATFEERGGRRIVTDYGRPERTTLAVRNGAGVIEMGYGVVVVEGDDRVEFVDDTVSNRVPGRDGQGVYALLLDPQGRIETDLYVYNAGERLLCFTPPARAAPLAEEWSENVFIRDVEVREASTDFAVFGVHGSKSTEKVASVLNGAGAPEPELSFVRGSMGGEGVTVIAGDGLAGEEGYEVVCAADAAERVFETLLTFGMNAVPFGYRTWDILTAEAGTPLFDTELDGRIPNVVGLRNALDFEKGCYVGQEVVSKVENRGRPSQRLVGLRLDSHDDASAGVDALPDAGASLVARQDGDDEAVGEVTRTVESPRLGRPIALGFVDFEVAAQLASGDGGPSLAVRTDGGAVDASVAPLPFVEGSAVSARLPSYPDE